MPLQQPSGRQGQVSTEPFVGEQDAAEFLGVSVRTIQRWRTEPPTTGTPLKFYKLGAKRIVYRISDCFQFAENRAFLSTSEMNAAYPVSLLDDWVEEQLTAPMASTAEYEAAK
jgi:hypothetical protein